MLDLYILGQWDTTSASTAKENAQTDDHGASKLDDPPTIVMDSARSWLANALIALGIAAGFRKQVRPLLSPVPQPI
jgi:hypothetical protein